MKIRIFIILANIIFGALILFLVAKLAKLQDEAILPVATFGAILGAIEGILTVFVSFKKTKSDDKEEFVEDDETLQSEHGLAKDEDDK